MTQKRNLKPLLIVLVLSLGLFAGLAAIRQRIIRPKATTGGTIQFSFDATPLPLASNQNFTLKIQANPNNTSFNAFEFRFTLPASVEFQIQDPNDPNNISANFTKKYDSRLPLATLVEGSKVIVSGASTTGLSGDELLDMVEVRLKVKPDQTGQATFLWDPVTEVEGKQFSTTDGQFAIGMVNGARLYFSSAQTSYAKGEDLSLKLHLDTNGRAVSSLDFKLNYDGSALEFQVAGADDSELAANNIVVSPDSGFDTENTLNMIDSQNKLVRVGLITDAPGTGATGDRELATILFKVKEITDVSSLTFTALQDSIVYDLNTQNILTDRPAYNLTINLITPTPTLTIIPSPTEDPSPSVTPSVTPTITPTPSITAVPTATLIQSPTTIPTCFDIWKAVFAGTGNGDADFNNDGEVDLVDFEMCRRGEASI